MLTVEQSVPPAFESLKLIQAKLREMGQVDWKDELTDRFNWWEEMVEYVLQNIGTLCLF